MSFKKRKDVLNFIGPALTNLPIVRSLDIGCGCGWFLTYIKFIIGAKEVVGIEYQELNQIEGDFSKFFDVNSNLEIDRKWSRTFFENKRIDIYEFNRSFLELELSKSISISAVKKELNIQFGRAFDRELIHGKFDIISAIRVVHYETIGSLNKFIKLLKDSLNQNGIIFLSYPIHARRENTDFELEEALALNNLQKTKEELIDSVRFLVIETAYEFPRKRPNI